MTEALRDNKPLLIHTEKHIILSLRLIVLANLCVSGILGGIDACFVWYFWSILGIFAFSELVFLFESGKIFKIEKSWGWIFLFDTAVITLLIFYLREGSTEIFVAYALTIAIAAISKRASAAFFAAILTTAVYAALAVHGRTDMGILSSAFMLRASFFFATALFVGYLSEKVQEERVSRVRIEDGLKREINLREEETGAIRDFADNIIKSMIDTLIVADSNGKIETINRAALELLGYEEEEIIGQPIARIFVEEEGLVFKKSGINDLTENRFVQNTEKTYLSKDGRKIPVLFSGSALRDRSGKAQGVVCIGLDITERKRAEEELREREAFNFALFQHNPLETVIVDLDGKVIRSNLAKENSGDRLPNIGDVMYKDYAGNHENDMRAELMKCIKSSEVKEFPEQKYGEKFLSITISPFSHGAIIISQDITERKNAQDALRESEQKFKEFFENEPGYCHMISPDGVILDLNQSALAVLGYRKEEIVGRPLKMIYASESLTKMEQLFTEWKKTGRLQDEEMVIITKKGDRRVVLLSAAAARDSDGKILHSISVQRDITERKKTEEELRKSSVQLSEALAELRRSHEELRKLSAHLQVIREEERKRISRKIHDELGHELINLKMDLSWLGRRMAESGDAATGGALPEKISSMTGLLDQAIQTMRGIATELRPGFLDHLGLHDGIEWAVQEFQNRTGIDCRLTAPAEDIALDEDQVTGVFRIFEEILTNVAQHAKATAVGIKLEKHAGSVTLEVQDNGVGITKTQISDSRALGLLGMRERAHSLGGEFSIRGVQGNGTAVTVRIPVGD